MSRTKTALVMPAIAAINHRCDPVSMTPDEFIAVREWDARRMRWPDYRGFAEKGEREKGANGCT
jgi:hypothetical protein